MNRGSRSTAPLIDEAVVGQAVAETPLSGQPVDGRPVIKVCQLEKRYRKTVAVDGISLEVQRGEVFGMIGPDGSGKSSLIRAIAGVQTYDAGSVDVFGQRIDSERSASRVKSRIGLMPQGLGNNLYAQLSVDENINYFGGLREIPRDTLEDRKDRLLAMTRLAPFRDRPMKQLSGGMKQKLGLICTLIHEPDLVLLDEPTTGVDPVSRRDFWAILTQLVHESEMTALVSTAYMDEAEYMDRVALLMDGQVLSQGKVQQIEAMATGTVVSFVSPDSLTAADRIAAKHPLVQTLGARVRVLMPGLSADEAMRSVAELAQVSPSLLRCESPNLEDSVACLRTADEPSETQSLNHASPTEPTVTVVQSEGQSPIAATDLVRDFGKFRAVDHVSFEVPEGRIFGLLGSNGAGKTTVIKMLTGLLKATSGAGTVAGADITRASQAVRERIGYMSQSFSLYTDMTAFENLEFYAGVYGLFPRERRQRIAQLIRNTGLSGFEHRMTSSLPMGLRQRLALGCALVHRPRVVFLDEPTSGVDVLGRRQFWRILVRLAREDGVAILVTTHYMAEAEHCDDLALMYAGKVIAAGTPQGLRRELEQNVGSPLALWTDDPLGALRAAKEGGFSRSALFGRSLRILSRDSQRDESRLRELLSSREIQIERVEDQAATMEDVFVDAILAAENQANRIAGATS